MRICIYSHSIAPSIDGVCRRFTGILRELAYQGHETLLFTMETVPEDLPDSTIAVTLDHMTVPTYPEKKVAKPTLSSLHLIISHVKRFSPSVIHIVSDCFSQMFIFCGLILDIPVVGSFHTDLLDLLTSHGAYNFQKEIFRRKECLDSALFDSCATTSLSFKNKLATQGVHCEHIIQTAVDVDTFSPSKRNEALRLEMMFGDREGFLCVYVGRISNEKRIDLIFTAIQSLKGKSAAYLAIIGDGPNATIWAERHGKENRVYCKPRFLTHLELAEIYACSDIHVSASEFETLGNTVLEAFACGIPVVVPRTQGFSDTVQHEHDGFLFRPGDSADASSYIQRLKDQPALRIAMGAAGRKGMTDRTISAVVRDLLRWYERGRMRCQSRRGVLGGRWNGAVLLAIIIPFSLLVFTTYDFLVNVILKPFIVKDTVQGKQKEKR